MKNSDSPGVRGMPGGHQASRRGRDSPDPHFFFANTVRCDTSRIVLLSLRTSSDEVVSFAILEERSWIAVPSLSFCFWSSLNLVFALSICLLMATMPETVAQRMESMEPSPADIVCRALGERLGTKEGSRGRAFLA